MEDRFTSTDVYLGAAVTAIAGTEPELVKLPNEGTVLFSFPRTDAVFKAIDSYNGGDSFPLSAYAACLRRLRGEMLSVKHNGKQGDNR
jgi:hypothetical protein